jgi:hypothetical protein
MLLALNKIDVEGGNVGNGVLTAPWVMTVLNIKTLPRLYLSRLSKP